MGDFLKWAFHYSTPDWVSVTIMITGIFGFVAGLILIGTVFQSGHLGVGLVMTALPFYIAFRAMWLEYKKSKSEDD